MIPFFISIIVVLIIIIFRVVKNKKNNPSLIINLIFLYSCLCILLFPLTHMTDGIIIEEENRYFAEWKPIYDFENKKWNSDFNKNSEEWFSDRFVFRKKIIQKYKTFQFKMCYRYFKYKKGYIDKKTHFGTDYPKIEPDSDKRIDAMAQNFIRGTKDFVDFCKKNNIKVYYLIVPQKTDLYIEKTFLTKIPEKSQGYLYIDMYDKISKANKVPFIYPYIEMLEASKNEDIFFKFDHHWTDYGAYIGYMALMKEIKKDFPNVKQVSLNDFNISYNNLMRFEVEREYEVGSVVEYSGCEEKEMKKYLDTKYKYFTHKDVKNLKAKKIYIPDDRIITLNDGSIYVDIPEKHYQYPKGANLKVFLTGSSVNENLLEILPYTFKDLLSYRSFGLDDIDAYANIALKQTKQKILEYKPDIVIVSFTINNLKALSRMKKGVN